MMKKPVNGKSVSSATSSDLDLRQFVVAHFQETVKYCLSPEVQEDESKDTIIKVATEIASDNVIKGFMNFMPEPVDILSKYEIEPNTGVHIKLSPKRHDRDQQWDGDQLDFLAKYADDEGYNRYYYTLAHKLRHLYKG